MTLESTAEQSAGRTLEWFAIAWSFATFFHFRLDHLRPWELRPLEAALVVAAFVLLARPRSRTLLALTCALQLLDYASVPQLSNHYTLHAFCSASVLLALAATTHREDPARAFLRWLRGSFAGVLAVLYFWSGLHKLNSAFFDPAVSCATALLRDLPAHGLLDGWLGVASAATVVGVELLAAVLLCLGRARPMVGVLALFHLVIGLTGYAYYLDFSALVFACWLLLLGAPSPAAIVPSSVWRDRRGALRWLPLALGIALGVPSWIRDRAEEVPFLLADDRPLWVLFGSAFVVLLILQSRAATPDSQEDEGTAAGRGRLQAGLLAVRATMLGVMLFLGLMPYLGLRTEATFSMFSNLQTENGWNHVLLPERLRVARLQEPVTILESDLPQLRWWLRRSDEVAPTSYAFWRAVNSSPVPGRVRYEIGGRDATLDVGVGERPSLVSRLLNRLLVFKPVVLAEPRPCTH